MNKEDNSYKTISEVVKLLNLKSKKSHSIPTHTLRFWEKEFKQIKPKIFLGNRRYYDKKDIELLKKIHFLLKDSKAVVVLPGKIGTLTELFVAWNSNYLFNKSEDKDLIPVFLKKDFWKDIVDNLPENMELDKKLFSYFENIEELEEFISELN